MLQANRQSPTPIALTIAGSDSGGGAGIQADLKTFSALGVYGCSAITCLTAQNTLGVQEVFPVPTAVVQAQIRSVLDDMPVTALKIGMLGTAEIVRAVADTLADYVKIPLVLDPVMVATSGDSLLRDDAVTILIKLLLPRAAVITPNLLEAAALLGQPPATDLVQMQRQAGQLLGLGAKAVLLKGGHATHDKATDVLVTSEGVEVFEAPRLHTRNTHGTGCTLASAIAAGLAGGMPLRDAVAQAKRYLHQALAYADQLRVGTGVGPVHHFYAFS